MLFSSRTLAVAAGLALLSPNAVRADEVVVWPGNLNGWVTASNGTAAVAFENGPALPPCPTGSVKLSVGADGDSFAHVRTNLYAGTPLANITSLKYSTYIQVPGVDTQAPYIMLRVDLNGDGTTDDILFFEPAYQTGTYTGDPVPSQGPVLPGVWQEWNALTGGWWALSAGTFGPPLVTLQSYIAAHPGAKLSAGTSVRIAVGEGAGAWPGFVGNVDCVDIGVGGVETTYNFELLPPDSDGDGVPDHEDDCPASDFRAKVDTGSGPTSIDNANSVDANGCTIQDHVNHCAEHAQSHGHYVSCIAELANRLKKAGVITNQQAAEMKKGAAQSNVGK